MIDAYQEVKFCMGWDLVQRHVAAREEVNFNQDGRPYNFGERIALVHSELSEALEADRKDLPDTHLPQYEGRTVELADAVIRIMGIAQHEGLPVAEAICDKVAYNDTREDHKPENRSAAHGKRY